MQLNRAVALSAVGVLAAAGIFLLASSNTGLAVLADSNNQESAQALSASISMQALGNARISAKASGQKILQCPQFASLEFELENKGGFAAERINAEFSESIKVQDCINCSIPKLEPSESAVVKAKACRLEEGEAFAEFKAVNSESERLRLD